MLLNIGVLGSNNPPVWKLTSGSLRQAGDVGSVTHTGLTCPASSSLRIMFKLENDAPPQYAASYWSKYHPHTGSRPVGSACPNSFPHKSKPICRTKFGVVLTIVSMLGSPGGGGSGPDGSFMFTGLPSTTIVASVTGILGGGVCGDHMFGSGKSPEVCPGRNCGSTP